MAVDAMPELVPLCEVDATLDDPIVIGNGPTGMRLIFEVASLTVTGERLRGRLKGRAAADWAALTGTVVTLDVRATIETEDGALILVQYRGRNDISAGPGAAPIYVAPLFETADERYSWLNTVQAVGRGRLDGSHLHYDWFEVR